MFPIVLSSLFLGACGSSSNNPPPPPPPPPTTTDVVSVGAVSGFGSIIVNGTRFSTSSATVTVNDEPGTLSKLRVGMVVAVRGEIDDSSGAATASDISFVDDAEGVITSINPDNNSFVVLGRTVLVDELTIFDNATFDTLEVGNVVQVSGQMRHQERIQATHVERVANAHMAGMRMQVKGEISGLDPVNQEFNIGTQLCNYSAAMLELGGADLDNGLYVEASSTSPMANGDLLLDRVKARDRDRDRDRTCDADCDFELEGYITAFESPADFEVDGFPVSATGTTVYVKGTADTLALDVKVAIDGTLDATGILIADRIVFRLPSLIEIEADVESIDAGAASIVVLGITVLTDESTLFRDDTEGNVPAFGLDDLAIGDRVEVRAYMDGDTVVASRLERDDADDSVTLKALVESVDEPSITMLGVTVTPGDEVVYQNAAKEVIDADTFFTLVTTDSLVRAEGTYDGTSITASQMFIRECESNCL